MVKKCGSNEVRTPDFGYINWGTPEVTAVTLPNPDAFIDSHWGLASWSLP